MTFTPENKLEMFSKGWLRKDSVLRNELQVTPGLLFEIAKPVR